MIFGCKEITFMCDGYKICPTLQEGEKCVRVQKYDQGRIRELFHEHVPSHRISDDQLHDTLKALIGLFGGWSAEAVLHSRLNNRKGGQVRSPNFIYHETYPEKGVLRIYLSSGDITTWFDSVVQPSAFEKKTIS